MKRMLILSRHALQITLVATLSVMADPVSAQEVEADANTRTASARSGAPREGDGFQNNYNRFEPKGLGDLIEWRWNAWREGLPPPPQEPTPRLAPDTAFTNANAIAGSQMQPAVTWIGHASVLLQIGGSNILADPVFSERVSPLPFIGPKRHVPPGLAIEELPHIDAVLISHNHYDHLDEASVRQLAAQAGGPPLFVVPLGIKAWLADNGIDHAVELDWWQSVQVGSVDIVFTPAQHWSGRGLGDRMQTLWGGFALFASDFQVFFSGDTGYSKDFADIHARFAARHGGPDRGFDLALLPVGAYEPRWFMRTQHVNPDEAVQIHIDLKVERSIGVHWGTFVLTDEALDEPPRALAAARAKRGVGEAAFSVMAIGETRRFEPRAPRTQAGAQP